MVDAERIKFGFVSRVKSTDNDNNVIIGSLESATPMIPDLFLPIACV